MEQFEIRQFVTKSGKNPFHSWFKALKNPRVQARIITRLDRLIIGNFGDHKPVGEGVHELRLNFGPGYRIYYGRVGSKIVLLLCAGAKSSQKKDIKKAKQYWNEYRS